MSKGRQQQEEPEDEGTMLLSREQLAQSLGVPPPLIDVWEAQGMPAVTSDAPVTLKGKRWWRVTRRELAEFLGLHPDSITHAAWLRPAIIVAGGRGKEQVFDLRLVVRAQFARRGLMESIAREGQAMRAALLEVVSATSADAPRGRSASKSKRANAGALAPRGEKP